MAILSIVIPALNEEHGIEAVLERLRRISVQLEREGTVTDVETIVVDDGSTDRTAEIASACPGVRVVRHETNRGYGAALKTGFRHATGDYFAFLDADGTYPAESLPLLLRRLVEDNADVVVGSRMLGARSGMPPTRKIGNWFFATFLGWLVGRKITDSASGMRVFRQSVLSVLTPLPDGLDLTPAMSTQALHEGLRIIEVAIPYDERVGRSKLSVVKDGVRFLTTIVTIARLYNPLKFFGLIGLAFLCAALLLGIQPTMHYLQERRVEDTAIYRLFTIMVLIITGVNVVTFGAFCNHILAILHPHRPPQRSSWATVLVHRRVIGSAGWIGLSFVVAAVVLNHETIRQYVLTRQIYVHWSYILTGAMLFLTGSQLMMGRFLIAVLEELRGRSERAQDVVPAVTDAA